MLVYFQRSDNEDVLLVVTYIFFSAFVYTALVFWIPIILIFLLPKEANDATAWF